MRFVALDLETTGLDTQKDSIIEIAAIRFDIQKIGNLFQITESEERSMLVFPGKEISQEVSMITGITNSMLIGKLEWKDICKKVREFIGEESIIVGHNVLFDIAMLKSHTIDLSEHKILDTFELSEIFSQDLASLNLGFIAEHYGLIDPNEIAHRALTDTRVSIRLFLKYLTDISLISEEQKVFWFELAKRDPQNVLSTLSTLCEIDYVHTNPEQIENILKRYRHTNDTNLGNITKAETSIQRDPKELISISGDPEEEYKIVQDSIVKHDKSTLFVPDAKTAQWWKGYLDTKNMESHIHISARKWISIEALEESIFSSGNIERKALILLLKLCFWIGKTKTGLIDELKFYGDERSMIDIFRCQESEKSLWREIYEKQADASPLILQNIYDSQESYGRQKIIKDITLTEDILRRSQSRVIDFGALYSSIEKLQQIHEDTYLSSVREMISMIQNIYESVPERPKGPLTFPPGEHGETYFITQKMLWHTGYRWLVQSTAYLLETWEEYKNNLRNYTLSRSLKITINHIHDAIKVFGWYHHMASENTNVVMNIHNTHTKLTFIPRSVHEQLKVFLSESIAYAIHIDSPGIQGFLEREYHISKNLIHPAKPSQEISTIIQTSTYDVFSISAGTVILTTSMKHARDLGQQLRLLHKDTIEVLIQGLSGGKGKMLSLFQKDNTSTILIGIIDTWRDEYSLWKSAKHIIIAKLPFDPPTDPYFLARTVGMSNNFGEYSEPIVTIRINTLIQRIIASGYQGTIQITDTRLLETEWGKRIASELL